MGMRGERAQAGLRGARPKPNSLSVRRQHNCKQLAAQSVPEEAARRIVSTFFDTVNNLITPASSLSSIPLFSFRSPKATWLQGDDLENVRRTIHCFFFLFFFFRAADPSESTSFIQEQLKSASGPTSPPVELWGAEKVEKLWLLNSKYMILGKILFSLSQSASYQHLPSVTFTSI